MDYRLLYSQRSLNDLDEILGHIAEEDADAASRFGTSLLDHIDLLSRFPRLGGVIRKRSRVRKLLHSPLLVYYRLDEDKRLIEIVHVRHGARKPASNADWALGPALPGSKHREGKGQERVKKLVLTISALRIFNKLHC